METLPYPINLIGKRLQGQAGYQPPTAENRYGSWHDRSIIGPDSPINEGVFLDPESPPHEAVVVDDEKDPFLSAAYVALQKNMDTYYGGSYKRLGLQVVFDFVKKQIPLDQKAVERFAQEKQIQPDQKVSLGNYREGGADRHQALLAGYLLERLIQDGKLSGKVSIQTKHVEGSGPQTQAIYTRSDGDKYFVFDLAEKAPTSHFTEQPSR